MFDDILGKEDELKKIKTRKFDMKKDPEVTTIDQEEDDLFDDVDDFFEDDDDPMDLWGNIQDCECDEKDSDEKKSCDGCGCTGC